MSVNNGSLIRIGQNGYTTRVGTTTFTSGSTAAFGPDGYMYFSTGATTVQVINVATGTLVRTFMLSQSLLVAGGAADWDFKDGYFWSLGGPTIVRVDPTTGVLQSFSLGSNPCGVLTMQAAAAWTYGNGNLGFSCSTTVSIVQIAVTNPSSATPTFQIVSVNNGPPGVIDGTSDPGVPTDLAVVKTGTQWFNAGDTLTYTITVTNNGAGVSTGFVLNDTVPAPLTGVTTDNPGACTVTGNAVRCVGQSLAVGASQAFTIAALSPGTWLACVTNTATLLANEADSNAANNSSSMTSCPSTVPLITCSSNPNLFNTGYNAATGGVLANLAKDVNWDVAGPFNTALSIPNVSPSSTATSMPPAGATWADANVGNIVPSAWAASPYSDAQWISQQSVASPDQGLLAGDWCYRYNFNLDASVDPSTFVLPMTFFADNSLAQVFVNGVAQGVQNYGTANPYYYVGFSAANGAQTTLVNNWQTGLNTSLSRSRAAPRWRGSWRRGGPVFCAPPCR